jgi:hypothetical protein
MKRFAIVVPYVVAFAAWAGFVRAQDFDEEDDDYQAYFGHEESEVAVGAKDLAEARSKGLSYRIGSRAGAPGGRRAKAAVHVVREGDTLWGISDEYFGDPWHWPELWSFNPEITNPHWIYPLDQVRLSADTFSADEEQRVENEAVRTAERTGRVVERQASAAAIATGNEEAPRVVVPRELRKPDVIFLRDQGYLDEEALRSVGQVIGGNEEHMMLSVSDQVYLRFKESQSVRVGQQYTLFREMKERERHADEQGKLVRILGSATIRSYDPKRNIARAYISEALDPIERGLFAAYMDRRFDLVAPKRNERNLRARVIASVVPYELLSFGDVVFLDVGRGHGIKPGNRFFVVRKGDDWASAMYADAETMGNIVSVPSYDEAPLPKEVVAELRVLKVRKHTTICVITRSDTDLKFGEAVEMRAGF